MLASVGMAEKSLEVWQAVHCAVVAVGIWLAGLIVPEKKLVPVWHCEQSPVLGCAASATLKVLAADLGRLWKPVYCAPLFITVGAIGYALIPIQTKFVSWQAEQFPVMPV